MRAAKKTPRVPIPRYRSSAGPAILSQGFRPFFLLAGLWALAALPLFLAIYLGHLDPPLALDPITWHAHEMIFGFAGAALAGFLLTAIPNWTGRLPLQGLPLLALVGLWVLARLAMAFGAGHSGLLAAFTLAFPLALLAVAAREIVAGRSWRNLPILAGLTGIALADALFLAEALGALDGAGAARRLAIAVFIALISVVGGRIVPSFTHNWLKAHGVTARPPGFGPLDKSALAITVAALLAWVVAPVAIVSGMLLALAAVASLLRLARWQGHRCLAEPLIWVLHLAFAWVPLGLALAAVAALADAALMPAAIHAFTAGAMGTMILAVMSRATLGHTGRAITTRPGLSLAIALVTLGALTRVASVFAGEFSVLLLLVAAGAWAGGYGAFLAACGPMLLTPRPTKERQT